MAVEGRVHRPPIAAMDEQREWCGFARRREEKIDELSRCLAVGKSKLGLAGFEHLGAIILGRPRPAGENLGMIRNGEAGAILAFEILVGHRCFVSGRHVTLRARA